MPEIEYAFLADAAEVQPGQKFHVLGGGVSRLGAHAFPFRHPHLALVVGLLVTSPELETEHDVRFVEDNWESPALGAWGLGWEVWLDGM